MRATTVRGMRTMLRMVLDVDQEKRRKARLEYRALGEYVASLSAEIQSLGQLLDLNDEQLLQAAHGLDWELLEAQPA